MITLHGVRAVVTDIEGTTSSLAFVKDELFPYARRSIPAFVRKHAAELDPIASEIRAEVGKESLSTQQMIEILLQWMDEDRKITPLKSLQGMVWREGYESGQLRGHVYEDAVRGLRRWHAAGLRLYVYSSGSIPAQKLLFAHTPYGDLTPLFSGYFDTTTGPKLVATSYDRIVHAVTPPARSIVFLSDHAGETAAAAAAGLQTVVLARDSQTRATANTWVATTFDDIALEG